MKKEVGTIRNNDSEKTRDLPLEKSYMIMPSVGSSSPIVSLQENQLKIAELYLQQAYTYIAKNQLQEAIVACKNAIEANPQLAEAYKVWGNALQKSGQEGEAIGCYTKALAIQPNMAEIYANVGSLFAKQKKWREAIEHFEHSLLINPQLAGAYRNLAIIWEELGETKKAWHCLFKALDIEPKLMNAQQYFQFGNDLSQARDWERAIAIYKYALYLDENFVAVYLKLVEVYRHLGSDRDARFYYQKSLEIEQKLQSNQYRDKPIKPISNFLQLAKKKAVTDTPKALKIAPRAESILTSKKNRQQPRLSISSSFKPGQPQYDKGQEVISLDTDLGDSYLKDRRWDRAIAYYQHQIRANPESGKAYQGLARAYKQVGKKDEAVEAYYLFSSLEPERISAEKHLNLGNLLTQKGDTKKAIASYQRAIQRQPDLLEAYLHLGEALVSQKDYVKAFACYQKLLEHNYHNETIYFVLARVSAKLEAWDSVVKYCRQAIELKPQYWEAYYSLGDALFKQQDRAEAVIALQKAIAINPQYFWSYQSLADVHMKLENWQAAAANYQKAIAIKDDFKWSHYNLAEAFSKLFQWNEAISAYQKAVAIEPDFIEAHAHLADALVREERWEEAIANYERAIELNPDIDIAVYRNLKEARDRKKKPSLELPDREPLKVEKWPYEPALDFYPPQTLPDGSSLPKISIVTPTYNQGEFIEETILSVIHQNYPNIEYILIDGGSQDNTMEIIRQYRQHFSYVVSETDKGQSNAINKGFLEATGEIMTWLNSDDRLAPGALYAVALAFYNSKADAVAGVCQIYQNGVNIEQHLTSCPDGAISLAEIMDVENCWLKGKFFYQPEVMFTREIWDRAGGCVDESLYYSMDYEMWARFASVGAKLKVIGHPVAQYRLHEKQKTSVIEKYRPELLEVRQSLQQRFSVTVKKRSSFPQRKLKIAVLNDTGTLGGAGIAHHRIARALSLAGHRVSFLAGTLDWSLTPVDCTSEEVANTVASIDPDLVVIGNIHNFQHPLEILETLSSLYLTLFVMHDRWLLTGRCGYTGSCEKYVRLCDVECPTWEQYPALLPEKIADAFTRKQNLLRNEQNLLVLCDSKSLKDWSQTAYTTSNSEDRRSQNKFQHLYYGLDLKTFYPHKKANMRRQLGLPEDKFIILSGSQSLEDERKGFRYLLEALEIANLDNLLVLCFGHDFNLPTSLKIKSIGYIKNKALLARYYSAADLFVSPALEEAFGQTFVEAAACGTPAVGFAVGGIPEAIRDRVSGRLVAERTPKALANTIEELYHDRPQLNLLSQFAPLYVANNYSLISSYHSIITALSNNGCLERLQMPAVSKFAVENIPKVSVLTIKGSQKAIANGQTNLPFPQTRTIMMDASISGNGWFPSEKVEGKMARWMEKLGTVIIEPMDLSRPLLLEISILNTVDVQLIYSMSVRIDDYSLRFNIFNRNDGTWSCQCQIPDGLLPSETSFLLSIETVAVKQLSPQDLRRASLLVESILIKPQS